MNTLSKDGMVIKQYAAHAYNTHNYICIHILKMGITATRAIVGLSKAATSPNETAYERIMRQES